MREQLETAQKEKKSVEDQVRIEPYCSIGLASAQHNRYPNSHGYLIMGKWHFAQTEQAI